MDDRILAKTKDITEVSKLSVIWSNRQAYVKRYLWPLPKFRREAVVMVDGKMTHGGLTDRLRNILSVYSFCKEKQIPFRVYYKYPRPLTDYLLPSGYDWRIASDELSFHILDSEDVGLFVYSEGRADYYNDKHIALLTNSLCRGIRRQCHIYGDSFIARGHYKGLFEELFRPSAFLESKLFQIRKEIVEPYESVTLRFQMLLGDFEEGDFEVLDEEHQEELINSCCQKIEELWEAHYFSTAKVLVTSDSTRFLKRIAKKEYVYTIPGRMEHMDYTHNTDIEMNAKPFVDLFMLMRSVRLTQLITGKIYRSGFPAFAAEIGDRPYVEIDF